MSGAGFSLSRESFKPKNPISWCLCAKLQDPVRVKTVPGTGMCTESSEQKNVILDQILAERRSYRMFGPEFPPEDAIRRIIHAGLLAPFACSCGREFYGLFPPVLCDEEGIFEHECGCSACHGRDPTYVRKPP